MIKSFEERVVVGVVALALVAWLTRTPVAIGDWSLGGWGTAMGWKGVEADALVALVAGAIWLTLDPRPAMAIAESPEPIVITDPPPIQPDVKRSGATDLKLSGPVTIEIASGQKSLWARLVCPIFKSKQPFSSRRVRFP